jgi:hypothetical protein
VTSASDGAGRRVVAPLNACGVQADAGESAAIGRRTRRAAEPRCSGRSDSLSQDRRKARSDRGLIANPRRRDRAPTAVTLRAGPTPRSQERAAPRGPPRTAPAASDRPWPSPLSLSLRPNTLGVLPRECVHPLRACTTPCPARAQRVRWSCTPCTRAAPLDACRPHPRIARVVRAPYHLSRARSRGYRRPGDITRDYAAHLLCVQARHAPSMAHESPRPRNPSLCHLAASASLRSLSLPRVLRGIASASCTRCARLRAVHGLLLADRLSRLRAGCWSRLRAGHGRALAHSSASRAAA